MAARLLATALIPAILFYSQAMAAQRCTDHLAGEVYTFPDGAMVMTTGMNVNPDGTSASYTVGDHGYTYLNNGVNLVENGKRVPCAPKQNNALCRSQWLKAEAAAFSEGSPEFCVFAMEVEPIQAEMPLTACEKPKVGRFLVGNGKGRPKVGKTVPTATGGVQSTYVSTTALQHLVDKKQVSIDAASVPGVVVPQEQANLLGSIVWVKYRDRQTFALVTDTGPSFGEGSIALHQILRYGAIQEYQPIGPIPLDQRCSTNETSLKAPFQSKPDIGSDTCKPGSPARSATDIRAYAGISKDVTSIILPKAKPDMKNGIVQTDLSKTSLAEIAVKAGYTEEKLLQMAQCTLR